MFFRRNTSAVQVAYPVAHFEIGVDGDHTYLAAEVLGNLFDQFRIAQGCRVDGNLIAPALNRRSTSFSSLMPPPTVKGMLILAATFFTSSVNVLRLRAKQLYPDIPIRLLPPGCIVHPVRPVAGIAEVYEIDSLNGFSIFYVQTGYYSLGKHI